eukprot:CAMPEP_0177608424 /NCGR_PEP_ID=MMETSP0419_2-20121207/18466_1 /TAXON_ID=582737 /ORGANISM="Tetraselmis sp., Strain GSL018" /LENGTH=348 /DNA_ID=CAMNT_0019103117 /DNA_START=811 /DNA_END=1854 /DNA_ORIENTATION=+
MFAPGCKRQRAFDSDCSTWMNSQQDLCQSKYCGMMCEGKSFLRKIKRDSLYYYCQLQAQQLCSLECSDISTGVFKPGNSTYVSPASVLDGVIPHSNQHYCGDNGHLAFLRNNLVTPEQAIPWNVPSRPILDHHNAAWIQSASKVADGLSPRKRRRICSAQDEDFLTEKGPYSWFHWNARMEGRSAVVNDELLEWSRTQARRFVGTSGTGSPCHNTAELQGACALKLSAGVAHREAANTATRQNDTSASCVMDCITRWQDTLQVANLESSSFAFHLWSRVASKALSYGLQSITAIIAGCLWISLKLQEHRLSVPSAQKLARAARIPKQELCRAEAMVMKWLDWAPLSQW